MAIDFRTEMPLQEQFWGLFQITGWNGTYHLSPSELFQAVSSNWFAVSAFDGDKLIGFGRVVSDGVLDAMIYEMIVPPEYQEQGIGALILYMLIQLCLKANIREIQLFCARGKRGSYEKFGFVARPEDAPGMQYLDNERIKNG